MRKGKRGVEGVRRGACRREESIKGGLTARSSGLSKRSSRIEKKKGRKKKPKPKKYPLRRSRGEMSAETTVEEREIAGRGKQNNGGGVEEKNPKYTLEQDVPCRSRARGSKLQQKIKPEKARNQKRTGQVQKQIWERKVRNGSRQDGTRRGKAEPKMRGTDEKPVQTLKQNNGG